jgi:hypothetical protein
VTALEWGLRWGRWLDANAILLAVVTGLVAIDVAAYFLRFLP